MEDVFTAENLVIITSKIEIDHLQWRKYFMENWTKLVRKNSKILVLAGIHGVHDGKLGNLDKALLRG